MVWKFQRKHFENSSRFSKSYFTKTQALSLWSGSTTKHSCFGEISEGRIVDLASSPQRPDSPKFPKSATFYFTQLSKLDSTATTSSSSSIMKSVSKLTLLEEQWSEKWTFCSLHQSPYSPKLPKKFFFSESFSRHSNSSAFVTDN